MPETTKTTATNPECPRILHGNPGRGGWTGDGAETCPKPATALRPSSATRDVSSSGTWTYPCLTPNQAATARHNKEYLLVKRKMQS
jgi:hypothetical protein